MQTEIIVSIVSGLLTLVGVCVTAWAASKRTRDDVTQKLTTAQAVTDVKIEELTKEVRRHNNFADRMPALEQKVSDINDRLKSLEQETK